MLGADLLLKDVIHNFLSFSCPSPSLFFFSAALTVLDDDDDNDYEKTPSFTCVTVIALIRSRKTR